MKKLLLSSVLLFSGFSISAAASDGAGTTENMIKAINKAREHKLVGLAYGGMINVELENELDASKSLLEQGKRDEAVKKIQAALHRVRGENLSRFRLGRTPGFRTNDTAALFEAILQGKPEVISSITNPDGLVGTARDL